MLAQAFAAFVAGIVAFFSGILGVGKITFHLPLPVPIVQTATSSPTTIATTSPTETATTSTKKAGE